VVSFFFQPHEYARWGAHETGGTLPVEPVLWSMPEIGNSDDVKVVRLDLVDDPKRKSVHQTTTSVPG